MTDNKTNKVLKTGTFSAYSECYKRSSSVSLPYESYTTITITDEDGKIMETITRKLTGGDLPKYLTPSGEYAVNTEWKRIEPWILDRADETGQTYEEIVNPYFQRNRVWSEEQQISYIEHIMKGGKIGKDIYFNSPTWDRETSGENTMFCIDGLQRITAVVSFLKNEFPIFETIYHNDIDRLPNLVCSFKLHVLDFQTEEEILTWYLQLNQSGTPHTKEELDRVRELKEKLA
jgi:hypothetical protein